MAPMVKPTVIGGSIVTTVADGLQVEHDIGVCTGQGDADAGQALAQRYSPDLIAVSLATAVQAHPYFAPAINAVFRKRKDRTPITVLNFFLGWTFLGWVVALIWSYKSSTAEVPIGGAIIWRNTEVEGGRS